MPETIEFAFSKTDPLCRAFISLYRTGIKITDEITASVKKNRKIAAVEDVLVIPRDSKKLAKGSKTYAARTEIITNFTISEIAARIAISITAAIRKRLITTNVFLLLS